MSFRFVSWSSAVFLILLVALLSPGRGQQPPGASRPARAGKQPVSRPQIVDGTSSTILQPVEIARKKQAEPPLPPGARARFEIHPAPNSGQPLWAVFSPDGKIIATAGRDDTVYLWDLTGKQTGRLEGLSQVYCLAFSPDGHYLATGNDDKAIHLWEVASGKERRELAGHPYGITALAFAPDGKTLACATSNNGAIRIWDVAAGKEIASLLGPFTGGTNCLTFAPDGKTLASFHGDGILRFWESATGKELRQVRSMAGQNTQVIIYAPDGKTLATAGHGKLFLREAATGREVRQLVRQDNQFLIRSVVFSPDGRALAAACYDGKVRIWETASGKERRQFKYIFPPRVYPVISVAFAPDGRSLVSAHYNNTAVLWDVYAPRKPGPPGKLRAEALEELWTDLACEVAHTAYEAVCQLAARPTSSVPFLRSRLRPAVADSERTARLIADLDSDRFAARERATRELEKLQAEPALRRALAADPSPEARRRIAHLLNRYEKAGPPPEQLRELRVVEVLEQAGTPEAQQILELLARGAPGARLTEEASGAFQRLARRPAARP
jgi:hypothetical protein